LEDRVAMSPRQTEVAGLHSRGRTQLQIAQALDFWCRTVNQHVILIRGGTRAATTIQAIAILVRQRVI
jgi:DNA-binding NarL/FixJ family response regulator